MRKFQELFQKWLGNVRSMDAACRVEVSRSRKEDPVIFVGCPTSGSLLFWTWSLAPAKVLSPLPNSPNPGTIWPFLNTLCFASLLYLLLLPLESLCCWWTLGFCWVPLASPPAPSLGTTPSILCAHFLFVSLSLSSLRLSATFKQGIRDMSWVSVVEWVNYIQTSPVLLLAVWPQAGYISNLGPNNRGVLLAYSECCSHFKESLKCSRILYKIQILVQ